MTALPPQTTIAEERASLNAQRVDLMQRRGEVATMLRNEYVDGPARRELQEELDNLTAKIRSVENELSTLDDAEQSQEDDRKAQAVAEVSRRRAVALETASKGIEEKMRLDVAILNGVAHIAGLVAQSNALTSTVRRNAFSVMGERVEDLSLTFLLDSDFQAMFADAARGQVNDHARIAGLISRRGTIAREQIR